MGQVVKMKKSKKRRRRAGSMRWILCLLFLLACGFGGYFFAQSSIFDIKGITVIGNQQLDTATVIQLSGLEKGEHIFKANTNKAEKMIAANYLVKNVTVKRNLPDHITITVNERKPVAAVQFSNGLMQVDDTGCVLKVQAVVEGLPLMIISGVNDADTNVLPGHVIKSSKLKTGLAVINQVTADEASDMVEIDVSNPQNIVIRTNYDVDIYVGDSSSFSKKYKIAESILNDEEAKGHLSMIKYVDVSITDKPTIKYNN